MNRFDTKTLEQLAGVRGAALHRMLRRCGVVGRSGVRREVGLQDICRVALAMELHVAYGLGRDEAASIAVAVPASVWPEVVEHEGDRWLWASRPADGRWSVAVITRDEAARVLRTVDLKLVCLCVPLARVTERVLLAVVQHGAPGAAGHA